MRAEVNLLSTKLYLEYYKNDITERYQRYIDRIVCDNDVSQLEYNEYVYITTLDKHHKLQQENKKYKEVIDKVINKIEDLRMEKWAIMGTDIMDILDILKEAI